MKPRICRGFKLCPLAVLCVLLLTSVLAIGYVAFASDTESLPPLYLTIIVHNEEDMSRGTVPKANIPDYDGNEAIMNHFARGVRPFILGIYKENDLARAMRDKR